MDFVHWSVGEGMEEVFRGKRGFCSDQEGLQRSENQYSKSGDRKYQCSCLRNQSWIFGHQLWSLSLL